MEAMLCRMCPRVCCRLFATAQGSETLSRTRGFAKSLLCSAPTYAIAAVATDRLLSSTSPASTALGLRPRALRWKSEEQVLNVCDPETVTTRSPNIQQMAAQDSRISAVGRVSTAKNGILGKSCESLSGLSQNSILRGAHSASQAQSRKSGTRLEIKLQQAPADPVGWAAVPRTQKALGLAGVIPFVALSPPIAAVFPLMPIEVVQHAALLQTAYGISIATFLGGVHWGMAMAEFGGKALSSRVAVERYIWSVTPSLLACPAVMLPPMQSSFVIAGTIATAYLVDSNFASRGMVPKWYMALRLPLTVGALFGMMTTVYHIAYLT